ncbi:MAG: hypothetical protein AB1792_11885 [Candidatus Zixiibacteriota bacterium]
MSFLERHQTSVAVVAALALFAGAAYVCSGPNCGANCPLSGLFSASTAFAGPGCSAEAKAKCDAKTAAACAAGAKATQANATQADGKTCAAHADGKTCSKDECIKSLMTEKGMTREQAEAYYEANCKSAHGNLTTAAATSTSACPHATATAAVATQTSGKDCGDKETCIAKCMKEKGYTRAEAEACWAKCQADKASGKQCSHGITTAAAIETTPVPSREACVDALVAKGMTREAAEAHVAKCEKDGMTAEAAVTTAGAGSGCVGHAKAAGAGCCAKKASTTTTSAEASGSGSSH